MKPILLALNILLCLTTNAQQPNWISFADLNDSLRKEIRPILLYLYTDWCKYCQLQENTTFSKPVVTEFLNENFYCLKLNAEHHTPITFLGRTYQPRSSGMGYHEMVEMLAKENGKIIFPTTLIFSSPSNITARHTGYMDAALLFDTALPAHLSH